jgi:hypothetical protein
VALCEGDDYWTDPNKLQMQVDIMEADESIGLVHSKVRVYDQQLGAFLDQLWGDPCNSFQEELVVNRIITLTSCFRKDLFLKYREFRETSSPKIWKMGDYPLWLFISYYSKTYFVEKPTGVYRVLQKSVSHDPDIQKMADFEISAFDVKCFFAKQFHHEHMLKRLATNLVGKMQDLSMKYDKKIGYDFAGLKKKYGFYNSWKLQVLHYILKHDFLRHQYMKYLLYRTGR